MGSMPFPLRTLGLCLRLVLLLGAGPTSGAAQATGGFTTAIEAATEAAVRVATTRVYPAALYAGRDEDGIPRYIRRAFTLIQISSGAEGRGSVSLCGFVALWSTGGGEGSQGCRLWLHSSA
jgi:hypothetical protein